MSNDKSDRVYRGGSWNSTLNERWSNARYARVAYRSSSIPSSRYYFLGLRLCRVVGPLEQLSEVADGHC